MLAQVQLEGTALDAVFADDTLDIACPACDQLATIGVDWLQANRRYTYEHCASELEIDSGELLERLKDVYRSP